MKAPLLDERKHVTIYTDGACEGNPGPGGYGIVLLFGDRRKELSGGFRLTTNNRMELCAAIRALEELKAPCRVTLYSDSKYLVDAMSLGWAQRWKAKGWMRNRKEPALNPDLWERLLALCDRHQVDFEWVKGHAGNPNNERCDQLSYAAIRRPNLPADEGYEKRENEPFIPPKVTEVGQPCLKCGTQVIKKFTRKEPRASQDTYYEYYLYCPKCRTTYTVEAAKRSMDDRRLF